MQILQSTEISEDDHPPVAVPPTHSNSRPRSLMNLDFTNAFLSAVVNSRAELVPSPRPYARNGGLQSTCARSTVVLCKKMNQR
jgi:hypothetical protein